MTLKLIASFCGEGSLAIWILCRHTHLTLLEVHRASGELRGKSSHQRRRRTAENHSHLAIRVLSLQVEYVQLLSSRLLLFLSVWLDHPTSFLSDFAIPLPSFRPGRALQPPEARQFCRFKVVEVIKLLKRSLGFASFPRSPLPLPFSPATHFLRFSTLTGLLLSPSLRWSLFPPRLPATCQRSNFPVSRFKFLSRLLTCKRR